MYMFNGWSVNPRVTTITIEGNVEVNRETHTFSTDGFQKYGSRR